MKIARRVLQDLECGVETREEICRLVRFHGRPTFLLHRSQPEQEVISLSWQLSNRLLHLFAKADSRGRISADMTRHVADLDLWKLVSEEQNCYDTPYPFANDHARFLFYRNELSYLQYEPRASFRSTMHMLSGLPGAGKDTAVRAQGLAALPVVSLDEIRGELDIDPTDTQGKVVQAARNACREHLRAGHDFVFNATNITRQARKPWIDMAASYEARVRIFYLEPPLRDIVTRNRSRPKPVPDSVIQRLCDRLDPPTLTECHELTIVTDGVVPVEPRIV